MNRRLNAVDQAPNATHIRILAGQLDRTAGSHVYHYELARRLANRGYKVSVMAFESKSIPLQDVVVMSLKTRDFSRLPLVWRYASALKHRSCRHAIRTNNLSSPDIVIGGEHLWLTPHFKRFPTVPWIYLPHGLTVRDEIENYGLTGIHRKATLRLYQKAQAWALSNADCIVRFTQAGCDSLRAEYPDVPLAPFVVNEIGIDAPSAVIRREFDGTTRFLIVGQLISRKGIDLALESLAQLKRAPWLLTIVGSGSEREALVRKAESLGISERVQFVGSVSSPSEWYMNSDLLLFPSKSESLGLVLVEAMSHGTPCLALKPDGKKIRTVSDEIIKHGHTGLLAGSPEEFLEMISAALIDRSRLSALGQAARREVLDRYSWHAHIARYERIFEWLKSPVPQRTPQI